MNEANPFRARRVDGKVHLTETGDWLMLCHRSITGENDDQWDVRSRRVKGISQITCEGCLYKLRMIADLINTPKRRGSKTEGE